MYIHGGGFILGRIDEQHNTALLVEQSLHGTQPIISVSIQYRLGALGYLHTPEPGNDNLALNDQRNALLWIQKFIGGFGGNEKMVTVFGESAGSMSICSHMLSPPPVSGPLFSKVILMSGVFGPTTTPVTSEEADRLYDRFLTICGIEERGETGLARLREMDVNKIVEASAEMSNDGTMWLPVQRGDFFKTTTERITWDTFPSSIGRCEWVTDVVLGTTSFEVRRLLKNIVWDDTLSWYREACS